MKRSFVIPFISFGFLLALIASAPNVAQAHDLDFTIVNKTGYSIKSIMVDESASDKWSENIMKGQGLLKDGETFKVEFSPEETSEKWDIKVIYEDGEKAVWTGLKLTEISKVNLFWNKEKGSSATVE